ncbi:MAG: preprotein translocase subunit YajC [Deltaproteobacteria bacterium]|nr:preprotein translocase subunit YajC [Deltaproteobacteria bacterium]
MYFLLLRPQQKAARDQQSLVATLKKDDEVVTSSGILGKIYAVADKVVTLEVANGVRIRVLKTFIQAKQSSAAEADATAKKDADDKAASKEGK